MSICELSWEQSASKKGFSPSFTPLKIATVSISLRTHETNVTCNCYTSDRQWTRGVRWQISAIVIASSRLSAEKNSCFIGRGSCPAESRCYGTPPHPQACRPARTMPPACPPRHAISCRTETSVTKARNVRYDSGPSPNAKKKMMSIEWSFWTYFLQCKLERRFGAVTSISTGDPVLTSKNLHIVNLH